MIVSEKPFITEISQEDFEKLGLKGYQQVKIFDEKTGTGRYEWKEIDLNKQLEEEIQALFCSGTEQSLEFLKCPITLAIHVANGPKPDDFYLDKYMDMYSGPTTFEFGVGIKHLYSTRDYFEDKEDYWKVLKRETKAIYRIHIREIWIKHFKLKHKTEVRPWPYLEVETEEGEELELHIHYVLDEENDKWVESYRMKVKKNGRCVSYVYVDENGNEIPTKNGNN